MAQPQTEYGLLGLLCGTGASGSRFSAGMIWLGSAHFAKVFLCCLSGLDFGIFGNFFVCFNCFLIRPGILLLKRLIQSAHVWW